MNLTQSDIAKNNTVQNCPLCKGKGQFIEPSPTAIPTKNPNRVIRFSQARLCICRKNELIENSSPYFANTAVIRPVSDSVAEGFAKRFNYQKSFWFTGKDTTFLQYCKAVFVYHRQNSSLVFQILSGLEAVQNFYVEQPDGVERTLYDLINNRDLLVILCTSRVTNKAMANTILQVVTERTRVGKATWVWTPPNFSDMSEYSEELQKILTGWSAVEVK